LFVSKHHLLRQVVTGMTSICEFAIQTICFKNMLPSRILIFHKRRLQLIRPKVKAEELIRYFLDARVQQFLCRNDTA
jgi:hypothetical protein